MKSGTVSLSIAIASKPKKIPVSSHFHFACRAVETLITTASSHCGQRLAMAGSQLKRLKASLREQGITGPQQSKKQRRRAAQGEQAGSTQRLQRGLVLDGIREQFNPFDLKHAARGPKFEVTSNRPVSSRAANGIKGRPGIAKAAGEELVSLQHSTSHSLSLANEILALSDEKHFWSMSSGATKSEAFSIADLVKMIRQ